MSRCSEDGQDTPTYLNKTWACRGSLLIFAAKVQFMPYFMAYFGKSSARENHASATTGLVHCGNRCRSSRDAMLGRVSYIRSQTHWETRPLHRMADCVHSMRYNCPQSRFGWRWNMGVSSRMLAIYAPGWLSTPMNTVGGKSSGVSIFSSWVPIFVGTADEGCAILGVLTSVSEGDR